MTETPDRQSALIVKAAAGHPLITIEHGDAVAVDVTSAERWENADGSVFAFVTLVEWPNRREAMQA